MSEMISVASGFQYSVNIAYDLNHDEKLHNFIPTKSSLDLLEDIILSTEETSTERARVLIGAYGKGKSHIVLTILSVLMSKKWELFTNLKKKVKENPELSLIVNNFYESGRKLLPVIISGSSTSMPQSFLQALQKALSENELMDVMPETNYQAAVNVIDKWEKDYPETYKLFREEIGKPVELFKKELIEYNVDAYEEFVKLYPKMTSGSVFNPFLGFDVIELYENVVKQIKSRGYSGIYVVYDEFSKFLEANIKEASVSDTKMLQDFAEKCNRSGEEQLHLMLISHKEIANYIDNLPKQKVDGWRGVSERFKHIHLNNNFTQTYEIISSVILKPKRNGWVEFCRNYNDWFDQLVMRYSAHAIFAESSEESIEKIIYGCYPLHPVTTFILPRLSERVAQNERTLFTFLSSKGISTLPTFLEGYNDDCFKVITPDMVFDYFEPLFRKESYSSSIHTNYILAKSILEKLEEQSLESKIIKTISLIYILEQFDKIKPTANELMGIFSLDYDQETVRKAIDRLIYEEYVIYYKLSNEFLRLKQSSGVNLKQQISDTIEKNMGRFSVKGTLNTASIDNYMYPSKYNDNREMTRYFTFSFIDDSELSEDVDWDVKSEVIEGDGVIYGIIPSSDDSIEKIRQSVISTSRGKYRYIFVIPNRYSEISDIVLKYNAVSILRDAAEGNELLFDEYEVIYEDLREVISNYIRQYTQPEFFKSIYIHNGEVKSINRKAGLTGLMSEICEEVYSRTPIIINEAANRTELTGTAKTSRNKIISGLLRNTLEPGLGLTGTGQEVSIMRSTLLRKNILVEENGATKINLVTGDDDMDYMFEIISGFILDAKRKGENGFNSLYHDLMSPEKKIGIRKALIPIYLAAVLHEYRQKAVIVTDQGEVAINADTLLQIEANPSLFRIKYLEWDPKKEEIINKLDDIFSDYINQTEKMTNSYSYIVSAMKYWYMSLPKYSKERKTQKEQRIYGTFIKLLKNNIGAHELLFVSLPKAFGKDELSDLEVDTIRRAKAYYDDAIEVLIQTLCIDIKDIFTKRSMRDIPQRSSVTSVLKDWYESLNPAVFEQLFNDGTDRFLSTLKDISNDEESVIRQLARIVTDLRIEDWSDKTIEQFTRRLEEYKKTAEEYSGEIITETSGDSSAYSLTFIDSTGNAVTKRFDKTTESKKGKLLKNMILDDIESMGHSITEQEKRQILMEVLKKMC